MQNAIFTGTHGNYHIQGIAVDPAKGYIYYSFTTQLIKARLDGTIVGSVQGLHGHLGCIDFNEADGKVYGSLEYKNDIIVTGMHQDLGISLPPENAFYITVFDVDKIDRLNMDAERDGVMTAVYLPTVVEDYDGTGTNLAGETVPHRYGCSGIDGTAFGPMPGAADDKQYLFVAYGIYSDMTRGDNDHQVLLCYDTSDWSSYAQPLQQTNMHHSGPRQPLEKFFVYTGNTTYGVQNLEYDRYTHGYFMAVYPGVKPQFPNCPLMQIDASVPPIKSPLTGLDETGMCLALKTTNWRFPHGSTGLYAYGDGRYLISQNYMARTGQCGLILPYVYDEKHGFVLDV